jgi:hypothetical protein
MSQEPESGASVILIPAPYLLQSLQPRPLQPMLHQLSLQPMLLQLSLQPMLLQPSPPPNPLAAVRLWHQGLLLGNLAFSHLRGQSLERPTMPARLKLTTVIHGRGAVQRLTQLAPMSQDKMSGANVTLTTAPYLQHLPPQNHLQHRLLETACAAWPKEARELLAVKKLKLTSTPGWLGWCLPEEEAPSVAALSSTIGGS